MKQPIRLAKRWFRPMRTNPLSFDLRRRADRYNRPTSSQKRLVQTWLRPYIKHNCGRKLYPPILDKKVWRSRHRYSPLVISN